jgi:hypothetical protein
MVHSLKDGASGLQVGDVEQATAKLCLITI